MASLLLFVVGVLVVGGLLFLAGSLLLGRGETRPPAELDRSPLELPDDRPVVADDVRGLRMSVGLRGYRMTEVDWLLDQLAQTLEERDQEIGRLREELEGTGGPPDRDDERHRPDPAPEHDQHEHDRHEHDEPGRHERDPHEQEQHAAPGSRPAGSEQNGVGTGA